MKKGKPVKSVPGKQNQPSKPVHGKQAPAFEKEFMAFFEKYGSFLFYGILLLMVFVVFKDYIFGNSLYLFKDIGSDSVNLAYPRIYHLCEYMRHDGMPSWSHYQGMGQNIFPFSLNNPFEWFLFVSGVKYFPYLMAYMEIIKIILGGILFFHYLKMIKVQNYIAVPGGLFFAFGGFMILGSGWNIFSTEAVYLVFLLIAFELLYKKNNLLLFPVAIALIGALQPFNLYLYGLFILVYSFIRMFDKESALKEYLAIYLRMVLLGLLGLGISAVFVFTELDQIAESPRVGGDASYSHILKSQPALKTLSAKENATNILRFYSSDLNGTGSNFRGAQNYLEAPLFYCGLLNLLLFTQFLVLFKRKRRIAFAAIFALLAIPLIFPYFRFAFWLFTGDYYRTYSFFVAMFILLTSFLCLKQIAETQKVNLVVLIATFVFLMIGLYFPYEGIDSKFIDVGLRMWVTLFLFIYAVAIYLLSNKQNRIGAWIVICLLSCLELGYFSYITVNKRSVISSSEMKEKIGYNDYTNDATQLINAGDSSFFRVTKDYPSGPAIHASLNDAKIQHFRSSMSYNPFNQKYYIKFLQDLSIIEKGDENSSRWAVGFLSRPVLQELSGNKYFLTKDTMQRDMINRFLYRKMGKTGDVTIFRNNYFLPLGFTYSQFITRSDYFKINNNIREFALLKAFIVEDSLVALYDGLKRYVPSPVDTLYNIDMFVRDYSALKEDTLKIDKFSNSSLMGAISLSFSKLVFISIPYDKGWQLSVDSKLVKPLLVNIGFMGVMLDKGRHTVSLSYKQPYLKEGLTVSLLSLVVFAGLAVFMIIRKRKPSHKKQ